MGLGTEAEAAAVVGYMDLLLVAMADGFLTFWSLLPLAGQLLQPVSLFFASGALFFRDNTHFQFQFFATRCH